MFTLRRIRTVLQTLLLAVFGTGVAVYAFVAVNSSTTPDPQAGRTYEVQWKQYGVGYLTEDQGRVLDGISVIMIVILVTAIPALVVVGGIERQRRRRAEMEARRQRVRTHRP